MTRFLLPALMILLASMAATANEVYRTVNSDGTIVYSDRPLSPSSQLVSVASRPADPEQVEVEAPTETATARRDSAPPDDAFAAALAAQKELRAEACLQAREAAEAYERAPRLYEQLPDGGRRYLSEEELVQARLNARQAVIDFCDE
jgi:hypothetical protein